MRGFVSRGPFFRSVPPIIAPLLEPPEPGHRHIFGEELIASAGAVSVILARDANIEELVTYVEFFGLVRHNLELIKHRRIINKIEDKVERRANP